MTILRKVSSHIRIIIMCIHPKILFIAWLCYGALRWDMTTAHYVISWSLAWRHISWISAFISIHTHDLIRQMQGLKIFKGSIISITLVITTRAGSNTTSSPTFLSNYPLDFHANGLTFTLPPEKKYSLFYKSKSADTIILVKPNIRSELLKAAEKFVKECKNASTAPAAN